jgi:Ca2+-binding EF-hand superfamily protein
MLIDNNLKMKQLDDKTKPIEDDQEIQQEEDEQESVSISRKTPAQRKLISFDDYMYLMSYLTKNQLKYENLMTKIFNEFDLDGDGLIKMDDLKQFMKITFASVQFNDDDISEMIKVADLNNDGFVDMEGKIS